MSGTDRLPDYLLERLAARDLSPEERAAAEARLLAEPGGEARLASLRRRDAEEAARMPPLRLPRAPARAGSPGRPRWLAAMAAPAAAGLLAAGLWSVVRDRPALPPGAEAEGEAGLRPKGLAPRLVLHRKAGAEVEELPSGAGARPGDLLQLGYVSAGRSHGAILSIDGRGGVTLHLPRAGERAAPLAASGEGLVPESFRLDDAPRFERFLLVAAGEPFEIEPVVEAARALAARPDAATAPFSAGAGREVASALVHKELP